MEPQIGRSVFAFWFFSLFYSIFGYLQ